MAIFSLPGHAIRDGSQCHLAPSHLTLMIMNLRRQPTPPQSGGWWSPAAAADVAFAGGLFASPAGGGEGPMHRDDDPVAGFKHALDGRSISPCPGEVSPFDVALPAAEVGMHCPACSISPSEATVG